jgi:hypothetical protein
MKLTQPKKVMDIIRPLISEIPDSPVVSLSDPLMLAVELMVKNNLSMIKVVAAGKPIGRIQLKEALHYLGLLRHGRQYE